MARVSFLDHCVALNARRQSGAFELGLAVAKTGLSLTREHMKKIRTAISKAIKEAVLKEFRHKCAICGRHSPQVHHLDEDPSNNDLLNLLPLCPNCHLQDTHDPTSPPDARKLKLFRKYKDPLIFDPRFHPIFRRLVFLREVKRNSPTEGSYLARANELFGFIEYFQMGHFYKMRIAGMFNFPSNYYRTKLLNEQGVSDSEIKDDEAFNKAAFLYCVEQIEFLIVEMLRYQGWNVKPADSSREEAA